MSGILLFNHISMILYFTCREMLYLLKWCPKGFIKVVKFWITAKALLLLFNKSLENFGSML